MFLNSTVFMFGALRVNCKFLCNICLCGEIRIKVKSAVTKFCIICSSALFIY